MNYLTDKIGVECLKLASNSKGGVRFGAVLVKGNRILGRGWNRLATKEERAVLSHVDYCVHAEQAAILDALSRGHKIIGSKIFVLGTNKLGDLTVKKDKVFICKKCPHNLREYNITVNVSHIKGWFELTADQAAKTAIPYYGKGYWDNFARTGAQ